jgi:valyl-tRNA synthetase
MEINKTYDPKDVEQRLYDTWQQKGYFKGVVDAAKKPFTIVIPPPNITGQLHMGHALDNMMQDAIIRFKRMQGFAALWLPGTDHASIATEVKIVEQMAKEGITKQDIGREAFLKRAWAWRDQYGGRIVNQLKKLGSSCDWSRERFTMDEGCNKAVIEVFNRLYEKGLIYRGDRIINWCPDCKTALSDAEVEYEEQDSFLWHIRYPSADGGEGIIVATTRPETMLGDTAVAVSPDDERYTKLVGKNVILPIMEREIPVISDAYVDKSFGTGAVKITPAHDPNDFEVGQRHNLPVIRVTTDDGRINAYGGKYEGYTQQEARRMIVEELEEKGLLVKTEAYKHNVGQCYRCRTTVEPVVSRQWFVSMKGLAQPAIEVVKDKTVEFIPERFEKTYFNWLNNIRDWCISRQLWWGHRIPAYYCGDCAEMTVAREMPKTCPKCGGANIRQDEDVLDTWFSSGLWPFSTLGWPENTEELKFFYPTSVLVTGYDIIFFWVARMIIFGMECMNEHPFDHVCVHGIVRDALGRKMSKSLNNGIDPLEIIDQYGADALRFSLANGVSPGSDMRFYSDKVEAARNFANKIWNASRFVLMNTQGKAYDKPADSALDIADKWILSKLNTVITEVTENLEKYEFGMAAQKDYDFLWSEFCDWYIEMAKPRLFGDNEQDKETAKYVLTQTLLNTLKLLHPFMPFITEEIFQSFETGDESIMISEWPKTAEQAFGAEAQAMESVMELIRGIRNIRAEMNVPPSKKARLLILAEAKGAEVIHLCEAYLIKLAYASQISFIGSKDEAQKDAVSILSGIAQVFMPLDELIDMKKEQERLQKEKASLEGEISRAQAKLANEGFIKKAPPQVVEEEKQKLGKYTDMLEKIEDRLRSF